MRFPRQMLSIDLLAKIDYLRNTYDSNGRGGPYYLNEQRSSIRSDLMTTRKPMSISLSEELIDRVDQRVIELNKTNRSRYIEELVLSDMSKADGLEGSEDEPDPDELIKPREAYEECGCRPENCFKCGKQLPSHVSRSGQWFHPTCRLSATGRF